MEVDTRAELGALSSALTSACAPGTRSLGKPADRELAQGERLELAFSLPKAGCVRAIAVAAPELGDVELELVDGAGRAHGRGELDARFELIGARGPICVEAGEHRAIATARRGAGRVRLEVRAPID
jgi:hypothetical protein